ncbi:MAG: group 1 truncated hemoglobin [Myxococcales bacterium]|nr:MAG: group 1 truncated hemoglobin [Myxococcales bacterium]
MTESLYERLGEAEGIDRIVDDVMAAHLRNPLVKTRYEAAEDIDHATKMAKEFFAAGSGGPDPYTGRDMLSTHKGMNISEQEFIAVVDDIMWALDKHGMTDETKKDVLAILYSLKGEIIRV